MDFNVFNRYEQNNLGYRTVILIIMIEITRF